jgi:peptidoglycan/LPS O-acetylase OafA/YrhL
MRRAAPHLPGLDLLRAVAIVWVMLFHSFVVGGLGDDWAWLSRCGWMGVDLFFVLSGFLIGAQVLAPLARGERLRFGDFYLRRAFRILPAFWAVLALYALWPAFREAPGMEPWWKFATFTMNVSIDYGRNQAFSHAWSLCVEEHFYLLFPALAWWLMRRPSAPRFVWLCALLVLGGIALRSAVWLHFNAVDPPRNWFIEDIYYPTWARLDGLLAGVALAVLKTFHPHAWTRWQRHANAALPAGLATTALALWLFRDRVGLLGNSVGWPVLSIGFGLLVFAGAGRDSALGRWRVPGIAWLAGISYSLYLTHKAVFHLVEQAGGTWLEGRGIVAFALYAGAALLGGALLHYGVERPFLAMRERWFTARRADAPMPAVADA